jgi:hypothetical protein
MKAVGTLIAKWAAATDPLRERFPLLILSGAVIVLCSLDQCTRGPSLTGLVLAQLGAAF